MDQKPWTSRTCGNVFSVSRRPKRIEWQGIGYMCEAVVEEDGTVGGDGLLVLPELLDDPVKVLDVLVEERQVL